MKPREAISDLVYQLENDIEVRYSHQAHKQRQCWQVWGKKHYWHILSFERSKYLAAEVAQFHSKNGGSK